ncbi:hypothetical protein PWT90_04756 [Aphanocladium album]|nr:hypothetical protein PWT90_04756 [Aphanocladium album]
MTTHLSEGAEAQAVGAICHIASQLKSYQAALVHICSMASSIFKTDDWRLFLHVILMFNFAVDSWVFDRSGMYASEALDLAANSLQIASILASFATMTYDSLGLFGTLKYDKHISLSVFQGHEDDCHLEETPVVARGDLFADGLRCYRARQPEESRWSHVIKFK